MVTTYINKYQITKYISADNIHICMEKECGIRVSTCLRNKIRRAAVYNNMSMGNYLDSIVPEIKMTEVEKDATSERS